MAARVFERGRCVEAVGATVALEKGMILGVPAHLRRGGTRSASCSAAGCRGRGVSKLLTPDVCSFWPLCVEALSPLDDMTSLRLLPFALFAFPLRRPRALVLLACSECSFSLRDCGSSCVRLGGMAKTRKKRVAKSSGRRG